MWTMGHFFQKCTNWRSVWNLTNGKLFLSDDRSSLANEKGHHYFLNRFLCAGEFFWWLTRPILALNCRIQVEQVGIMESAGGPLVLALRSLRFLSASQILFFHRELLFCWWDLATLIAPVQCVSSGHLESAFPPLILYKKFSLEVAYQALLH